MPRPILNSDWAVNPPGNSPLQQHYQVLTIWLQSCVLFLCGNRKKVGVCGRRKVDLSENYCSSVRRLRWTLEGGGIAGALWLPALFGGFLGVYVIHSFYFLGEFARILKMGAGADQWELDANSGAEIILSKIMTPTEATFCRVRRWMMKTGSAQAAQEELLWILGEILWNPFRASIQVCAGGRIAPTSHSWRLPAVSW